MRIGCWGALRCEWTRGTALALALTLAACASSPLTIYDLTPASPGPIHDPPGGQIRIGQPVATLDLDSERILVRESTTLAMLPGARWSEGLASLFRNRLVQTFQNAGLSRLLAGGGAAADYQLDLDIRAFEFDAVTSEAHVDVAARIVTLNSGRVADVQIFSAREPVATRDSAAITAGLDQASEQILTQIVKFVAKRL
jgi:cholesterol transport system auxiliary component